MGKKKNEEQKELEEKALQGAAGEAVQRFGSAVREHVAAYTGKDNGVARTKGLKSISESRVNTDYAFQNLHQQAGFSAEVKEVANRNAESIINGQPQRLIRTDDLGRVNDPLADHVQLDASGNEVPGSAAQMKFVGYSENDPENIGAPKRAIEKLQSKKFHKYVENDLKIEVPSDFYDGMVKEAENKLESYRQQLEKLQQSGKVEEAQQMQQRIEDLETIKKNLRKSSVSSDDAMFAREHPLFSTAKSVARVAHQAGIHQAEIGAAISGSLSIIRNAVAVIKGEIELKQAVENVAKDTGKAAAFSYATAFAGAAVKGVMQNSANQYVQTLSKTTLSTGIVSAVSHTARIMKRYASGELSGEDCLVELTKQGVGDLGATMYSTLISSAVSGTGSQLLSIASGMAGSTLGYMAAVKVYEEVSTAIKDYRLAREERIRAEERCKEVTIILIQYREEMLADVEKYLSGHAEAFLAGFDEMDRAIAEMDSDGFIAGNVEIQTVLQKKPQFTSQAEFDNLMLSDDAFKL